MIRVNKIRLFFLRRVREKIVRDRERRSITRAIYRPTDRRTRRWCAWKPKMSLVFGWERVRRVNELTFIQWAMRKMEIEGKEFCTVIFFMCVFAMEKHWGWNIQLAIYNRPTDGRGGVRKQTEMFCFRVMKECCLEKNRRDEVHSVFLSRLFFFTARAAFVGISEEERWKKIRRIEAVENGDVQ